MPRRIIRTKARVEGECWYGLSKIAGFRWYMNRIENLLLSIYAEHPDQGDPNRVRDGKDIYASIWEVLKDCETEIINVKKCYRSRRPPGNTMGRNCGCWDDNDCAPGWHCNPNTALCEPGNGNHGLNRE